MKKLTTIDAEAVSQRYSVKMVFLEISQNSQEISCNFIKKEALAQVFPCEFCEICRNVFSYRTPPVIDFFPKLYLSFLITDIPLLTFITDITLLTFIIALSPLLEIQLFIQ